MRRVIVNVRHFLSLRAFLAVLVTALLPRASSAVPVLNDSQFGQAVRDSAGLNFREALAFPLVGGTVCAWLLHYSDAPDTIQWREEHVFPITDGRSGPRVERAHGAGATVDGWIARYWIVDEKAPPGKHSLRIFVGDSLARTFDYILRSTADTPQADAPSAPRPGEWLLFEETTVAGKIAGAVKKGYIIRTTSGGIYEVADPVYLYEYEYSPDVLVLTDGVRYKLIIEGIDEPLICRRLNPPPRMAARALVTSAVVESYIESEFDGLDLGNIYRLGNGQIWEQTEAWIWIWIWVMPKVTIWNSGGVYKMKVENIDHAVTVRRLK